MLVDAKSVSVQASGMKATTEFKAKLDGMMFDNLINGIYSNKIGAGIREYATNARDGHARRGNLSRPFEVGLPNRDKAFFEVRDFGSSLTHEEVFEIFAVLGESTKRNTNDETGCLGLGSKSAFAYTNAFAVTCWKNGTKRDYSCYIGEGGQPLVSLISEIKSKEEEGVRVSYAVKQQDIDDFNKEASNQLRGFDPQPIITRSTPAYKPLSEDNLILKGTGWKLYKAHTEGTYYNQIIGKPMAIQGAVAYPIDPQNVALSTALRVENSKTMDSILKMLRTTDIMIQFEIGQLKMTTSREELSYDPKTVASLAKRLNEVIVDIQAVLDAEYAACKTLKEARILKAKTEASKVSELERTLGIRDRYWQGQKINTRMVFGAEDDKLGAVVEDTWFNRGYWGSTNKNTFVNPIAKGDMRVISDYNYRNKFGEIKSQFQWPERNNKNAEWHWIGSCAYVSEVKILIEIPSKIDKNANSLLRRYWKDNLTAKDKSFIWLRVASEAEADNFFEQIYHEEPKNRTYLHKLTELKMPKKASSGQNTVSPNAANPLERKIRIVTGKQYAYSGETADYKLVDFSKLTDKLPVIFFKDNTFYTSEAEYTASSGNRYTAQEISRFVWTWAGSEFVYVINGQQWKFYEDHKQYFQEAMPWLKEKWKARNKDWEKSYAETTYKADNKDNIDAGVKFKILKDKFGVNFKSLGTALTDDKAKLESAGYARSYSFANQLPDRWREFLQTDLDAAVKKYPQPVQTNLYLNLLNIDPVLKYLVSDVSTYGTEAKLVDAIKHYKTLLNE